MRYRYPLLDAALWIIWQGVYLAICVAFVAFVAPVLAIALWPVYQWLGIGWAVFLWALFVFGTRNSRPTWYSDARKVDRHSR